MKVYSNCETVELFVNTTSVGTKRGNNQDFSAAGLHWLAEFKPGGNVLRAIGRLNRATVEETLTFDYQTSKWGSSARIELKELARDVRSVRIEARLADHGGNLCLAARHRIWFGVTGDGKLLDNMSTCTGSRNVEVYNGRAEIKLMRNDGTSVVSARCKSLATAFLTVH